MSPGISFAANSLLDEHRVALKPSTVIRGGRRGGVGSRSSSQPRPAEPQNARAEVLGTCGSRGDEEQSALRPLPQPSRRQEIYLGGDKSESLDWGTRGTTECCDTEKAKRYVYFGW